jgi:Uma2 family endonuclease
MDGEGGLWTGRRRCHAEIEDWGHDRDRLRAAAGIPRYWIVDPREQAITVLALPAGATSYNEEVVVRPGEPWSTDQPYPLTIDPAEVF